MYFFGISCYFFSFLILFTWVLSFFLDESDWRFAHFLYLFEEPVPGFIRSFEIFFNLYESYFCSDLDYFFLTLTLGFVCCCFSSYFRSNVDCLFEIFQSLNRPVMLWTSLSELLSLCHKFGVVVCFIFICFQVLFGFFLYVIDIPFII